ncbi:MAG: general secretion pathway protein GspK [Rhodospirillaceae bacterium]|nr:general secretion pathway protein GspK [Rhodospirillaceae bacterium]
MTAVDGQRHAQAKDNARGFILPLTLWAMAAAGLVVVAVNEWVNRSVENARALRESMEMDLALQDIENEILFAWGTRPVSYRGIEVGRFMDKIDRTDPMSVMTADFRTDQFIRLDGRPYVMESNPDYIVRIYDTRGMVNLNVPTLPSLRRLLGLFQLDESTRNSLVDALQDYTDRDDLTRLAGAEAREYERLGRRPPANSTLMTPMEAQYVLGWDKVPELWQRDLEAPFLTTCTDTGLNPNTASREALLSNFPDMTEDDVAEVLKKREERPFRNARELSAAGNTPLREDPFFFSFAPGRCFIIEVTRRDNAFRTRFSLTIEGFNAKTRPWHIDYVLRSPPRSQAENLEPLEQEVFPAPDTMDANQRRRPEDGDAGPQGFMDPQQNVNAPPNL